VVTWRVLHGRSTYEEALSVLPESTLRTTFTDWAEVRAQAKGSSLDAGSSHAQVSAFLNRAFDLDLTSGSGLSESTYLLMRRFGFSPLDAQWEVLGQSRQGQVDVLRVADDVDMPGIERALRRLGYTPPPDGSGSGGTWVGGPDLVAGLGEGATPVQQNVVVLPDDKLVLMSDSATYAGVAASVATGSGKTLLDAEGVADLADAADDPDAAVQWTSSFACEDLTMRSADAEDQRVADQLVAKAGKVSPLDGLVMAQQADRSLVVGMHFETSQQASSNLQTRVNLAAGDAPGQGGSFAERFSVTSGQADGRNVVLRLRPRSSDAVLSDISTGPVLFATC
jgi:hypothetical protein